MSSYLKPTITSSEKVNESVAESSNSIEGVRSITIPGIGVGSNKAPKSIEGNDRLKSKEGPTSIVTELVAVSSKSIISSKVLL